VTALPARRGPAGPPAPWWQWVRANPGLAAAVVGFCVAAVVGLVLSIPPGLMSAGRTVRTDDARPEEESAMPADEPAAPSPAPPAPAPPAPPSAPPAPVTRPWTVKAPEAERSPRGLGLAYGYRALPPGGESRYEWFVRLEGLRSVVEGIDEVRWQMDPPPKDGGNDLVSRNRAGDGFPLLGDGPGGWFGVVAAVRYKDGKAETLSRRIELPD
jgi:hypothetical protein